MLQVFSYLLMAQLQQPMDLSSVNSQKSDRSSLVVAADNYTNLTKQIIADTKKREDALPVRSDACRSQFFLQPKPTKKVVIFFHGFTACPYQFIPLGQALYAEGYNVLIPLMPGHGQAGNWNKEKPSPLPTNPEVYQEFALDWLQKAQNLGDKVIVGGLSGGGTLAGWLSLERPQQIEKTLLFAPYLSAATGIRDLVVRNSNSYFEWPANPGRDPFGYSGFMFPSLRVFLNMGRDILAKSTKSPSTPMLIVSSESDQAVGNRDHRILFNEVLKRQPKTWYQDFERSLQVPHAMMTEMEGNKYYEVLNTIAKAYIKSDLTWDEVQEIGYRMTRGKSFDTTVAELNLKSRVSPEMAAMMTMVDKRTIVINRNRSWR